MLYCKYIISFFEERVKLPNKAYYIIFRNHQSTVSKQKRPSITTRVTFARVCFYFAEWVAAFQRKEKERKGKHWRETRAVVFARGVPERWGGGNKEQKRGGMREREGKGRNRTMGRAKAVAERTREFNFSVTLHLRSLIPPALCASRGGAERHSIAGLHLRFSIMEIQRALGANATLFLPLPSFQRCRHGSVFRGKINKFGQTLDPCPWTFDGRGLSRCISSEI